MSSRKLDLRAGVTAAGKLTSAIVVAILSACASSGATPGSLPVTTVQVGAAPAAVPAAGLPDLAVTQISAAPGNTRRIEHLDLVQQDLPTVLYRLAESFGLEHDIDPSVRGQVTLRRSNITLEEALDQIVLPQGYQYQLTGNLLRVIPVRTQTRIFELDYVSISRTGIGSTVAQTSLSNTATGGFGGQFGGGGLTGGLGGGLGGSGSQFGSGVGAMGGGTGGGGAISSVTVADFWDGIRVALEGFIFAGTDSVGSSSTRSDAAAGAGALGGQMRVTTAFSRSAGGQLLSIDPFAGIITVTAAPETLAAVESYLTAVERSVQRQVLIEAKIVEVQLDRNFEFGIDWSFVREIGGVNLVVGAGSEGADLRIQDPPDTDRAINIVLRALESQGDVNVLSSPRVSVLNNQPASFAVTRNDVFFNATRQPILGPDGGTIGFNTQLIPQQIAVGITLDVLAQISAGNVITMSIRPSVTEVVDEKTLELEDGSQASAPVIDSRNTDTMVRARDGETIVIGGLMQTRSRSSNSGVPVLRDIPVIGRLFSGTSRSEEKRELVIFITPTIVAGELRAAN